MKLVTLNYTSDVNKGTPSGYYSQHTGNPEETAQMFKEELEKQYPGKIGNWKKTSQNTWEAEADGKEKPISATCQVED